MKAYPSITLAIKPDQSQAYNDPLLTLWKDREYGGSDVSLDLYLSGHIFVDEIEILFTILD